MVWLAREFNLKSVYLSSIGCNLGRIDDLLVVL